MRPDWAIFEIYWLQIFLQKKPNFCIPFWAIYNNVTFQGMPAVASFWGTIGKFGLLFIPSSGHTVYFILYGSEILMKHA